jgi:2-dehydro-3-deoxyphosphogalactonate aldolase
MIHRHIIAILRGLKPEDAVETCTALVDAGITMIEVPLNSPEPFKSIGLAAQALDGRAEIGAGTVLTVGDADKVHAAGGRFVVSPDCNPEVIGKTKALGMGSYPGVFTPTEAFAAIRAGADGLKFFPCDLIGPVGIRAMKAVLPPEMAVYAVGGANPDNFADFFAAGCTGFGLGSYLFKPGMSAQDVGARAARAVAAYDNFRKTS